MKTKAKNKILVKCKRKDCKSIIDIAEIRAAYRGKISSEFLEDLEAKGYCSATCYEIGVEEEKWRAKSAEQKNNEFKEYFMDEAFAVFSSLMDLIRKDKMTEGLLNRINKEIEKAK